MASSSPEIVSPIPATKQLHGIASWPMDGLHPAPTGSLDSNKFGSTELSNMSRIKPQLTGPMSVQPTEHRSIKPAQSPPMMPADNRAAKTTPKKPATNAEAQRAAKAEISRRDSLRKQRQAQKV